jgi:exosortase
MAPTTWFKVISVSVLMIATFRFNLVRLWLKTNPFTGELNWRHSVCVPIIGLYYLYVNRDDLRRAKTHVAWSGLGILLLGVLLFAFAIWPGQNDFLKDFGMVVALFGVVLLLCGWEVMKIAWFPIVFLVCAIPWPELVYSFVASPLQHLAASVAVGTLRLTGVEALNSGTKIIMSG